MVLFIFALLLKQYWWFSILHRITIKEFKSFLSRVNCKITTQKLLEYFNEIDVKSRGELRFDDFARLYQKLFQQTRVSFNVRKSCCLNCQQSADNQINSVSWYIQNMIVVIFHYSSDFVIFIVGLDQCRDQCRGFMRLTSTSIKTLRRSETSCNTTRILKESQCLNVSFVFIHLFVVATMAPSSNLELKRNDLVLVLNDVRKHKFENTAAPSEWKK